MSLNAARLQQALAAWFAAPQAIRSQAQAEAKFARVYHDYAREGEDVSGERATTLVPAKFQSQLRFAASRTVEQFARQLDAAFVSYWTGAVFAVGVIPPPVPPCPNVGGTGVFSTEASSVVTVVAAGALFAALLPVLRRKSDTVASQARAFATAMDTVTKSAVTVLITGVDTTPAPTGPLPITNTCTVF